MNFSIIEPGIPSFKNNESFLTKFNLMTLSNLSYFAKAALASMNPYAAMCNQMLKNVFSSLENGSNEVEDPFKPKDSKRG